MAKKKNKQQITNNIQQLNLEIDYDKLAESIVKAQEKTQEQEDAFYTTGAFSSLASLTLRMLGVFGILIALFALIYGGYYAICCLSWNDWLQIVGNVFACIFWAIIIVAVFMLSLVFCKSGKELEESKDKHFVVAVFSALSGLIALIVALIALFK